MSQATVEEGGTQPQSENVSEFSTLPESQGSGSSTERAAEGAASTQAESEANGSSERASDASVSSPLLSGTDVSSRLDSSEGGPDVSTSSPLAPVADGAAEIESDTEESSNEPSKESSKESSEESSKESSQCSPQVDESSDTPPDADNADQRVHVNETPDAEEITQVSPDLSKSCPPPDLNGTSQPASETVAATQDTPDVEDSAPHVPDANNADKLVVVNETTDAGTVRKSPDLDTTSQPPSEPIAPTQQPSDIKDSDHVALDTEPSSHHSPGINGSAQVAPDATDCSQLVTEDDDSTPLLTSSNGDESRLPLTPTTATTTTTTTNNNTASTLRSRFNQAVRIQIPEDFCSSKRMATSLEDITSLRLWKGIIAEFVGVLLLVLVGCGSCLSLEENGSSSVVQISLCFGLSVATIVWNIGHISGGHINPAVTLALLATRKISLAKAIFFVLFQLVGAVVGAGILMGLTPAKYQGTLGSTLVSDNLDPGKGLGVEIFITFVLVFTVFASIDSKRRDLNGSTPLTIGLSVTMCHLFAVQYTGASMNTARSFGPALVTGKWQHHWVYWVGPITGGVAAGLLYEYLFAVNASLTKVRACVLSSDYDDDKFQAKKIKVRIVEEDPEGTEGETFPLTRSDQKAASEDPSTPEMA